LLLKEITTVPADVALAACPVATMFTTLKLGPATGIGKRLPLMFKVKIFDAILYFLMD